LARGARLADFERLLGLIEILPGQLARGASVRKRSICCLRNARSACGRRHLLVEVGDSRIASCWPFFTRAAIDAEPLHVSLTLA